MHVMHALVPGAADAYHRRYTLLQPLVGMRRCAKNMHDPNGLLDTRSASPCALASIAAVGLHGILSEASSASSQKRRTAKNERRSLKKPMKHRKIVFVQAKCECTTRL